MKRLSNRLHLRGSLMTCSAALRMAGALLPLAALWGAVAWAMAAP